MKSIKIFATVGAIALLGTTGFTSCNQNNSPVDPGKGDYKGETVKTEIVIRITDKASAEDGRIRYMPSTTPQKTGSFRGMDNIYLIPLDTTVANPTTLNRNGNNISLDPIVTAAAANSITLNDKNAGYYSNVSIPLGTKKFLFYGKAIDESANGTLDNDNAKHKYGIVETALSTSGAVNTTTFSPVAIYTGGTTTPHVKATNLATYVTTIANSDGWKDNANAGLDSLYKSFIQLEAGSSAAILSTVNDLYNTINRFLAANGANATATAIKNNITAHTKVIAHNPATDYADTLVWNTTADTTNYAFYPDVIDLPEGAAILAWNSNKFDVKLTAASIGGLAFGGVDQFAYPASLQYFGLSSIKTSQSTHGTEYGNNYWNTILGWYNDGGTVYSNTKSVAIVDSIDYGVGLLASTVQMNATSFTAYNNEPYALTNALKLKGILIGDQKEVDYLFEQTKTDPAPTVYTVYDNYMNGADSVNKPVEIPKSTSSSVSNYTLVLPTKNNDGNSHIVKVALELVNTNKAFHGAKGQLIPEGGTFYLIGELKIDGNYSGTKPAHNNIFFKDYETSVTFNIGETSLATAYYTIPDLRSSNLELGLAVDLAWKNGLVINVNL